MRIVHSPACQEPLNEHSGNEWCITIVTDEPVAEKEIPAAHYKQSVQGNTITDYRADYEARRGEIKPVSFLGVDKRDKRTGQEAYDQLMAERNGGTPPPGPARWGSD